MELSITVAHTNQLTDGGHVAGGVCRSAARDPGRHAGRRLQITVHSCFWFV
jgi:hypothetical protein